MKKYLILSSSIILIFTLLTSAYPGRAEGIIGTPPGNIDDGGPILQYSGCGGKTVSASNADYEQQVIDLVNQERAKEGLNPLKRSAKLTDAARYHAADMGQDNYFDHSTMDRQNGALKEICGAFDRIATYYSGANGENAAAGYSTPQSVVAGWMSSKGHRDNILNSATKSIGVGFYQCSGDYYYYWVQDFGTVVEESPVPVLGNLPEKLTFLYSIPDKKLYPPQQDFAPANIGSSDQLSWQVNNEGSFFSVSPSSGTTPTRILVTPDSFNHNKVGTYTGQITVNVTEPSSVVGAPYTLDVNLKVVDYKIRQLFLPGVLK